MLKLDIDPRPRIAQIDLTTRRLVASNFMGNYASVFKGRGIVFESYREYTPSDDASLIDWRASSRGGKLVIKEFVEERNLDVFFLIDSSYTMVFGSHKKLKHEYAAELVASMAFAILEKGDAVGVGLFSDQMRGFLRPRNGMIQYRAILRELTNPAYYDGPCDFESAIKTCIHTLTPNTLFIIVTDLVNLEGKWESALRLAGTKFEAMCLAVRDPRDDELPDEGMNIMLENPSTGEQLHIDSKKARQEYAKAAKQILDGNLLMLRRARIPDVQILKTNEEFAGKMVSFFEMRKRRWR